MRISKTDVLKFICSAKRKFNYIFNQTEDENPYKPSDVNPEIFREYDIRGIYNKTLFDEDAFFIGRAAAYFLQNEIASEEQIPRKVVVGYDGRISTPVLVKKLLKGLSISGCHITNIGICTTPMLYFAVNDGEFDMGIMVTGSHNPKEHNGFKFCLKKRQILGADISHILELIKEKKYTEGLGREIILRGFKNKYIDELLKNIDILGNLKVAWDLGNGATAVVIKKIIKQLPGQHFLIFDTIDGNFPNRSPDPTHRKNLEFLSSYVTENNCDFGIAFDGDGDRVSVVTHKGKMLYGDQLLGIFAESVIKSNPGATIVSDIKASSKLKEIISKCGGRLIMERVGHSIIENRLKESKALLAGEMSGHFFFADKWYGFDDGIYSALRFLEIFSKSKDNGINIFENVFFGYSTPEIRIDYPDEQKFHLIENIKNQLKEKSIEFNGIDGVRVEDENGWWLIRASNTQAQLTLRLEGKDKMALDKQQKDVIRILSEVGINLSL